MDGAAELEYKMMTHTHTLIESMVLFHDQPFIYFFVRSNFDISMQQQQRFLVNLAIESVSFRRTKYLSCSKHGNRKSEVQFAIKAFHS